MLYLYCMVTTSFYNTNCFIAFLRYHRIFLYQGIKETDFNFSAYISTPNIQRIKDLGIFSNIERAVVSKKMSDATNTYKVYLSKEKLVQSVVVLHFTKQGKPDMRYGLNLIAKRQTLYNAFFSTTISEVRPMKITNYKRILIIKNW